MLVAGFGVVFIDADFPGDGPSCFPSSTPGHSLATTGIVSGADASQLFRGIVAIDGDTDQPVTAITSAPIVSGQGWPGNGANEGVVLDDLVFSTPAATGDGGEICDNCVDDDGDDFIDRSDRRSARRPRSAPGAASTTPRARARRLQVRACDANAGRNFVTKRCSAC